MISVQAGVLDNKIRSRVMGKRNARISRFARDRMNRLYQRRMRLGAQIDKMHSRNNNSPDLVHYELEYEQIGRKITLLKDLFSSRRAQNI
jgi:hypothetical protein